MLAFTFGTVISFGPFLTPRGTAKTLSSLISYTGFVFEFAGEDWSGAIPVYRTKDGMGEVADLLFRVKDLGIAVKTSGMPVSDPDLGELRSLECLIAALYLDHHPATPLMEFLGDIREKIELKPGYHKRKADFNGLLTEEFQKAGFELIDLSQYGRSFTVSIGWVFPQDRINTSSRLCLYAGAFECTPTPERTLGKGKWMMPMETILGYLFSQQLKKMCRGKNPVEIMTEEGKEMALATFKWKKVSLLTPKELKKARIDFVRQHPDLHSNYLELAKAMKNVGLYSDTVENYAISKQMPGLIEAGKAGLGAVKK